MTPDDAPQAVSDKAADPSPADLRGLRLLRLLVTLLTLTMIAAGAVLIWLFVTRFPDMGASPRSFLPDTLKVPAGATVQAVTRGSDWWAVVIRADDGSERIEIHGAGGLRQSVAIER